MFECRKYKLYIFQVYATDLESLDKQSNHTDVANITINILDCNDNLPIFDKGNKRVVFCIIESDFYYILLTSYFITFVLSLEI